MSAMGQYLDHIGLWANGQKTFNITFLELFPIVASMYVWGSNMTNKKITLYTDSQALTFIINKLSSPDKRIMVLIRRLTKIAMTYNIVIHSEHVPCIHNILADALSRLQLQEFRLLATALETLDVKAFGDMGQTARLRLIRDRFIAGHSNCDLRRHLASVSPETPIRVVVDRCRVWESHADPAVRRFGKPNPDPTYPTYAEKLIQKLVRETQRRPPAVIGPPVPTTLEQMLRSFLDGQRQRQRPPPRQ